MPQFLILDFGSQSTHLIGRRLKDLGFTIQIVSSNITVNQIKESAPVGLIFSGSPDSVYEKHSSNYNKEILNLDIPKLGICYGFQCTVDNLGGVIQKSKKREYGECVVNIKTPNLLFDGLSNNFITWMSHGDSIVELGNDFELFAESHSHPAAAYCNKYKFWGLQFHPELAHSQNGTIILQNFVEKICLAKPEMKSQLLILEEIQKNIKKQVQNNPILILVSGGVDSSVAAVILLKTLPVENVHLMYIDTGLMRKNETKEIIKILSQLNAQNLHIINAKDKFFSALAGIQDPEAKRKIIGDLFVSITIEEVSKLNLPKDFYLAQGTLYTDLIESGQGVGNKAKVIKSHHNVNSPLIIEKRNSGKLIEPLKELYKDNARELGLYLGLPKSLIFRHPFPGPGLGIRIIGKITPEKCRILQEADAIYIEELHKRQLYYQIWQAFAIFIPIKTVGVAGDIRQYGYTIAIRAVSSIDGISADIFDFPIKDLKEISSRITNEIPEISRVVYDISSKPPATIEWE